MGVPWSWPGQVGSFEGSSLDTLLNEAINKWSTNRGHFFRISEVAGPDGSSIILPSSGLKQFQEIVGHFVEITKDRIEGMAGANVRTVDPPQRRMHACRWNL
ncbi:hypothetical protein V6N13_032446 [Hibiscus sabdariffa]|uniref:Uncharacterized protein n=1 Tax=Hibiscus sabdariffa TaxID=183260 RepID=A0ABR2C1H4_9ROSI